MMKIKLSDLMGKYKYNISKLSEVTGLSRPTLSSLYHEKIKRLDLDTLEKLCKAFNCNVQDLIEYIPEEDSK